MIKMTLTEKLADYTLYLTKAEIDPKTWELAKRYFIDCFGCMIAGAGETASLLATGYSNELQAKPAATIIGSGGRKTDSSSAAMVNGISAHIHDLDDVSVTMTGHPSVVMLPTVLALGQELKVSGQEVLLAYITGVEVASLVGRGLNPTHYSKGWHNTSTLGVFGAAAAAAKLLQLNRQQLIYAFGIAASEASGLKGNFGTMTKSLHAGRAASKGIFAAKLAKLGYDSNPRIMEIDGGFVEVTTGLCNLEAIDQFLQEKGSEFLSPGLAIKPYPSCKGTHNGIDAALYLAKTNKIKAEDIEKIEVMVQPIAKDILKYPLAKTPLEGKFSMSYCIACALLYGNVALANFMGERIEDPRILALMGKVEMTVDDRIADGKYFNGTWETAVRIILKSGQTFEKNVRYAKGDPENSLTDEELFNKFDDCALTAMDVAGLNKVKRLLKELESIPDINELLAATENAYIKGK